MEALQVISWLCQLYLVFFFLRSAFRKVRNFEKVSAEFRGWGYVFPRQITLLLICVWIVCSVFLLVPKWAGVSAIVLLSFMLVAFATLVVNREFRRLREPSVPIALLAIVIVVRWSEVISALN